MSNVWRRKHSVRSSRCVRNWRKSDFICTRIKLGICFLMSLVLLTRWLQDSAKSCPTSKLWIWSGGPCPTQIWKWFLKNAKTHIGLHCNELLLLKSNQSPDESISFFECWNSSNVNGDLTYNLCYPTVEKFDKQKVELRNGFDCFVAERECN